MNSIIEVKNKILKEPENWQIPFMDFVDDFRRYRDFSKIETAFIIASKPNTTHKGILK